MSSGEGTSMLRRWSALMILLGLLAASGCGEGDSVGPARGLGDFALPSASPTLPTTVTISCGEQTTVSPARIGTSRDGVHFIGQDLTKGPQGVHVYVNFFPSGGYGGSGEEISAGIHVAQLPPGEVKVSCSGTPDDPKQKDAAFEHPAVTLTVVDELGFFNDTMIESEMGCRRNAVYDYFKAPDPGATEQEAIDHLIELAQLAAPVTSFRAKGGYVDDPHHAWVIQQDGKGLLDATVWQENGHWQAAFGQYCREPRTIDSASSRPSPEPSR